jgi:acyl-CoA thioesterase
MLRCMTQLNAVAVTDFDRTVALHAVAGPDELTARFVVDLDASWSSLIGVHGGYLVAVTTRGAERVATGRAVRTVTTSFLRAGQIGPGQLEVREIRRSRSLSTVVADLFQDEHLVATSRITLVEERSGVEWSSPVPLRVSPLEDCVPVAPPDRVEHLLRVDARLDPASLPFTAGPRAVIRGYLRPFETRRVDAAWLTMASDWFPPPAFVRVDPPTGGVSIDLTTHLHQPHIDLGEDEWLVGEFEIVTSTGGLAVEHGRVARQNGTLVSESFQTRWTAGG